MRRWVLIACVAALATLTAGSGLGQTVYSDGDFADPDWQVEVFLSGDAGVNSVTTAAAGGNPGAFRELDVWIGDTPATDGVAVAHLFEAAVWDPATSGTVLGVDCSVEYTSINAAPTLVGCAVEQGGDVYVAIFDVQADEPDWTLKAGTMLTASDFLSLAGTMANPDFGPSAPTPLRFGFATGQSDFFALGNQLFHHGIDNWRVAIHADALTVFVDGFDSGGTDEWSATVP